MKKFTSENFRFTITVIDGHGCRNGHEVGDAYTCEYGCPMPCGDEGGFCAKTMLKLFPLLEAVRMGGDWRTIGQEKYRCEFDCPDGAVRFQLEATDKAAIRLLSPEHLLEYAEVIRRSFATVARDFGFTRENCPRHTSFVANEQLAEKIQEDYFPFGLFLDDRIIGFASLTDLGGGVFELSNVAVLPEYRHFGYGTKLLDFCKAKVQSLNGGKITIGIIEESAALKNWYARNGFRHMGTRRYDGLPFLVGHMEWEASQHASHRLR